MKRLTLRELHRRVGNLIIEYGDMPVFVDDNAMFVNVADGQRILLATNVEMINVNSDEYELIVEKLEYEEHGYYKLLDDFIQRYKMEDTQMTMLDYCQREFKKVYP